MPSRLGVPTREKHMCCLGGKGFTKYRSQRVSRSLVAAKCASNVRLDLRLDVSQMTGHGVRLSAAWHCAHVGIVSAIAPWSAYQGKTYVLPL